MKGTITTITGIIEPTIEIGLEIVIDGMTGDLPISLMTGVVITNPIIYRSRGNYRQDRRSRQNYKGNDSRQRYGDRS